MCYVKDQNCQKYQLILYILCKSITQKWTGEDANLINYGFVYFILRLIYKIRQILTHRKDYSSII